MQLLYAMLPSNEVVPPVIMVITGSINYLISSQLGRKVFQTAFYRMYIETKGNPMLHESEILHIIQKQYNKILVS